MLPVLLGGAAVATVASMVADPQASVAERLYGWWYGLDVTPVGPPKPVPAPSAPQTREQMTTWTPEQMQEQYRRDTAAWLRDPFPALPPKPPQPADNTALYAAAALGLLGLLLWRRS